MIKFIIIVNLTLWVQSFNLSTTQNKLVEVGNNAGKHVVMYQKAAGIGKYEPYCMAGIYWSFDSTAKKLKITNPIYKTGSTISFLTYYKKHSVKQRSPIKKYDIVILRVGEKWKGHALRIDSVISGGIVRTFEFNTGSGNQREGDGNYFRRRNLLSPIGSMHIAGIIGIN